MVTAAPAWSGVSRVLVSRPPVGDDAQGQGSREEDAHLGPLEQPEATRRLNSDDRVQHRGELVDTCAQRSRTARTAGVDPMEIARRAGHSSVAFTLDRYGHLFLGADTRAAEKLELIRGGRHAGDDVG